jgi:hypothetical protein
MRCLKVLKHATNKTANDTDDSKRLYELAMSCTGEYGALFIGDATNIFEDKKQISWRKWL